MRTISCQPSWILRRDRKALSATCQTILLVTQTGKGCCNGLQGGANGPPPSTQEPLKSQESKPKYKFQKLWEELSKETHSSGLQAEETAPHRTPRKRRGKRAKLIEQGDSPREPVPQKKKCTAKQQAKEAAAEADMNRKDIAAKLFEQGCKHALFQKVHVQMDLPSGKGHWHEFLDTIVTAKEPQCKSCSLLYAQYIKGQDVDALNFPSKKLQEEIEQYAAEAGKRKRGRPCKGEKKPTDILLSWIQSNRPKVYSKEENGPFTYHCHACNLSVNFHRDAVTYLKIHERDSTAHARGLTRLGLSVDGAIVQETKPCVGIAVSSVDGRAVCAVGFSVGQPCMAPVKGGGMSILEHASWRVEADEFFVRHKNCTSSPCVSACQCCLEYCSHPKVSQELAAWAYRLDLVELAQFAAYGSEEEVQNQVTLIKSRDYMQAGLAGNDFESLQKKEPHHMVWHVRRSLESISRSRRNTALHDFIQLRVSGLADVPLSSTNMQKDVLTKLVKQYSSALQNGTCLHDDLRLASMVASGDLRRSGGAVPDALFKSTMLKIQRGCQSRPNSSTYFDNELSAELIWTIGRGKHLSEMLRRGMHSAIVHGSHSP